MTKTGKSFLGLLLLATSIASAADLQISASLDRNRIALNEQAVLSIVISGGSDIPNPQIPEMPDFQIMGAGRSQSYTWVNGKASASVAHNFVMTPSREGTFTIPPIRVSAGGQNAETAALTLTVVKGDPSAVQGGAHEDEAPKPAAAAAPSAPAVFISGTVDKTSVVVGEPITFTFRLHNRVRLMSQPSYQPPEMTGFWTEDLPPQRNYQTSIKGMPYSVTEVRTALFPSVPGKARVGSAQLAVSLENFGTDPFGSNFFNQFFGRAEEKVLRTEPISITVKPLPEPKPADFKGAVGEYTLSAQVDKPKIAVGQPLTLSLTVSGKGNIKSIPDLPLPALTNFRTFDASAATNVEKKEGTVTGSKTFKTVLIPTASGDLTIPPISFTYFDLSSRAYKTVKSSPLVIHVQAGAPGAAQPPLPADSSSPAGFSAAQPGVKRLGDDIRYIHSPDTVVSAGPLLYQRKAFRIWNALLLLLLTAAGAARLYFKLFLSDNALYRFRKAKETALARLNETDGLLAKKDFRAAGNLVANTLQDFMAAKLGVERRSQSLKEIIERLRASGLSEHTAQKIRNLWETLDLFQFAPAQVQDEEIRSASRTAGHVIEEVEKEILWKK